MFYPTHPDQIRQLRQADLHVAAEARPHLRAPRIRRWWLLSMLDNQRSRQATRLDPSFELFAGLGKRRLRQLENRLGIHEVDAGTSLGTQGQRVAEFVLLLAGEVAVSIDGHAVAVLGAGNHFGERALLGSGLPTWQASFIPLTPVSVAVASPNTFAKVVADFPSVAEQVRQVAAMRGAYITGRTDATTEASYPVDHHYEVAAR